MHALTGIVLLGHDKRVVPVVVVVLICACMPCLIASRTRTTQPDEHDSHKTRATTMYPTRDQYVPASKQNLHGKVLV